MNRLSSFRFHDIDIFEEAKSMVVFRMSYNLDLIVFSLLDSVRLRLMFWAENYIGDVVSFSIYHIRKQIMSICPITGDAV